MQLKQKNNLLLAKRAFQRMFHEYGRSDRYVELSGGEASTEIADVLLHSEPAMICRFGSVELQLLIGFLRESKILKKFSWYQRLHWEDLIHNIHNQAGFFPKDKVLVDRFYHMMMADINEVDILGSWRKEEHYVNTILKHVIRVRLRDLEPYFNERPWSKVLEGKKVLVIHPFENTIRSQFYKREKLFDNKEVLPDFELKTIKAVQSIAGSETEFSSWFEALEHMKSQIDETDFDIALIGCGAYGFPLAAHVKRIGKKAVHIGGALQILFGIMGKRWENNESISKLKNEHWVYPSADESPVNKNNVEDGCYW